MMSKKHTPGPWKIIKGAKDFGSGYAIKAIPRGGYPYFIAEIYDTSSEENLANARLIAAAPALLAACEAALTVLAPFEWTDLPDGYAVKATVDMLRAAIAQAQGGEGRTP
jgi:hypothetical protein